MLLPRLPLARLAAFRATCRSGLHLADAAPATAWILAAAAVVPPQMLDSLHMQSMPELPELAAWRGGHPLSTSEGRALAARLGGEAALYLPKTEISSLPGIQGPVDGRLAGWSRQPDPACSGLDIQQALRQQAASCCVTAGCIHRQVCCVPLCVACPHEHVSRTLRRGMLQTTEGLLQQCPFAQPHHRADHPHSRCVCQAGLDGLKAWPLKGSLDLEVCTWKLHTDAS